MAVGRAIFQDARARRRSRQRRQSRNQRRAPKPSRIVRTTDQLTIRRGPFEWTVIVKDVAKLRGPAAQAQALYEETEESVRRREAAIAQMKLERPPEFDSPGRPSKKDRRAMARFTKRGW